jgi:ABC-2 type transport system permease protein
MSTTTRPATGITFGRVVRFEWIKFWSVCSTAVTLSVAVAGFVGIGLLACAAGIGEGVVSPAGMSMTGSILSTLVLGVLGVLVMTGEYSTGLIRTTLIAVPRRLTVLAAKAVVFVAVSLTVMVTAALVTFMAGQALIGGGGMALTDDGVPRVLLGTVAYETGAGLLGLLLGALIRSTPAALSTYVAVTFLLTTVTQFVVSEDLREDVGGFLPAAAGEAMGWAGDRPSDMLSPGQGALVFGGYLVLAGVLAGWRLRRSDA